MKKQLLNLSAVAILLAIASFTFGRELVQPVSTLEIKYAEPGTMKIDGFDDEAVYSAEQSTIAFVTTGSTGADADFTFTFKVAYDLDYMYLFAKILDDVDNSLTYTTDANPWTYDCIEVFLSLDTTGSTGVTSNGYGDDTNCVQLRINRGIDSVQQTGRATADMYINHFENTGDGWLCETAIPWKAVLATGQDPEDIMDYIGAVNGFDMSGADSDTPGPDHRDCQTAWDSDDPVETGTEDNAWTDRSVFGIMTLEVKDDYLATENFTQDNLVAYPNPANNTITFSIEGMQTVEIYNITGAKVLTQLTTGQVDISSLMSGIYFANINGSSVKFIKEE